MKSSMEKFHFTGKAVQGTLKRDLMRALYQSAGLEESNPSFLFKIQARNMEGSYVTATLYTTGTLLIVGHGTLFDLTHTLCKCYHRGIPKTDFTAPNRKATGCRKTDTRKGSQLKPRRGNKT
jgi:hypothetical protein